MRCATRQLLPISAVFLALAVQARAAEIIGLGNLPSFDVFGEATAVSDDGGTVVGYTVSTFSNEAYRWTPGTGILGLGFLEYMPESLTPSSVASAVSGNGQAIAGTNQAEPGNEAFLWTLTGGMVGLGDLPGGETTSTAHGISSDGTTVVGHSWSDSGRESFVWTQAAGMVGIGNAPAGTNSPIAVSGDGSTVVTEDNGQAIRWTANGGIVSLGALPTGEVMQVAAAVSENGQHIVGEGRMRVGTGGNQSFRQRAFYWREGEGIIELGNLPGGSTHTHAYGVSNDGGRIVGFSGTDGAGSHAFLWTEQHGMQRLYDVLEHSGADLAHWSRLGVANAISADGRWVVGRGLNADGDYESFLADLLITGDLDGNGYVDAEDLDILLANWGAAVPVGSLQHGDAIADGVINSNDLQAVLDQWGYGMMPRAGVPEPGSLSILVLTVGALATTRSRR